MEANPFRGLCDDVHRDLATGDPHRRKDRLARGVWESVLSHVTRAQQASGLRDGEVDSTPAKRAEDSAPAAPTEDPAPSDTPDAELRVELSRSGSLGALPATRGEVTDIVALYGAQARALLGRRPLKNRQRRWDHPPHSALCHAWAHQRPTSTQLGLAVLAVT